jgi:hypothetical protein
VAQGNTQARQRARGVVVRHGRHALAPNIARTTDRARA